MSKIKIEAITNVHVGSGETLNINNDFSVAVDSEGHKVIGIIDPRKVMNLIGVEHVNTWVQSIERKRPFKEIVRQYAPKATLEDYSLRIVENFCDNITDTFKECIHDGLGRPYIPGSSIKGAIRTAVLANLTAEMRPERLEIKNKYGKLDVGVMEAKLFGNNPNVDVFRFLHVGDAIFGELFTSAITMANINEREKQSFWDTSKKQTIEAISEGDETTFEMRLKLDSYQNCVSKVAMLPQSMSSLPILFETINAHTLSLLESEIEYWTELKDNDDTQKVDDYIAECRKVMTEADRCERGKSCILRVGHGCGWRFITGAWSERSPQFDSVIVPASRPNNRKYEEYDFPKSRRVVSDSDVSMLLGFVKMTITN